MEKLTEKEKKMWKIWHLLVEVDDPMFSSFFDSDSEEMLDEKIAVLTARAEGKPPRDIPDYYKVLEKLPADPDDMWDL